MSVRIRMFLLALVITVCVSALVLNCTLSMDTLSEKFHSLRIHEIATGMSVTKVSRDLNYLSRLSRDIMLGGNYEKDMQEVDAIIEECSKQFEILENAAVTDENRKLVAQAHSDTMEWINLTKTMMTSLGELPVAERYKAYREYERVITPPSMVARESFEKISQSAMTDFQAGVESFEAIIAKSAAAIIAICLFAVTVIIATFVFISRTILLEIRNRSFAEEALSASEEKARALLDGIDSCAYLIDRSGIILDVNAQAANCAGKDGIELVGTSLWAHCSTPDIAQSRKRKAAEAVTSGEVVRFEDEDAERICDQTYYPICNAAGEVVKLAVLAMDVTEQKKALLSLKYSEKRFRTLIEDAPIGISMFRDLRYTYVNRAFAAMFGCTNPCELIGTPIEERFASRCRSMITDLELRRGRGEQVASFYETNGLRRDGSEFPCHVEITKLMFDDGPMTISFARDFTEREQARDLMIQAEKMTMIGGLAAGIAHEINNPIGIIVQNLSNIERRLASDSADNQEVAGELGISMSQIRAYLERRSVIRLLGAMNRAGQRTARIVSNMLQFSHSGGHGNRPAVLADLIERAIDLASNDHDLKKRYDFRSIRIIRSYTPDLPQVPVNATEFEQVMINLIKNAAQSMAQSGASHPEIALDLFLEGTMAVIQVRDNGPGMDSETSRRIFQPFFTTKDVGTGTGLGLSVSYALVTKRHNGLLSVDSTPGEGTCFTIKLPLA